MKLCKCKELNSTCTMYVEVWQCHIAEVNSVQHRNVKINNFLDADRSDVCLTCCLNPPKAVKNR